ncbi:MAG TPA: hypothetical protein VGA08_04040 [Candidatus Saccharimonadales bacterium]
MATRVYIFKDGKRLYGWIIKDDGEFYTISWDNGQTTVEKISKFNGRLAV